MKRLALAFAALCLLSTAAFAHAAGRGFVMLLPTGWVIAGGALVVFVSFVAVSLLSRLAMRVPAPVAPLSPAVEQGVSLISAFVLGALIVIGFTGPRDPVENLLPLAVWTLWWVEIVMLHPLFGNLWEALNPFTGPHALLTGRFGLHNGVVNHGGVDALHGSERHRASAPPSAGVSPPVQSPLRQRLSQLR